MREKVVLLLAGAACALGGVAVAGGMAGAQGATASSDAQIVRELKDIERALPRVASELRGGSSSSAPTLKTLNTTIYRLERELMTIRDSTGALCYNFAAVHGRSQLGCR